MISEAVLEEKAELEDFLVVVFGEDYRVMARQHIVEMFSNALSRPIFLLKRQESRIMASVAISEALFTTHTWGIGWVAVHPEQRGNGLGQEIVKAALEAIAVRVKVPSTAILSAYPEGASFYNRLGFAGATIDHAGNPFLSRKVCPNASGVS